MFECRYCGKRDFPNAGSLNAHIKFKHTRFNAKQALTGPCRPCAIKVYKMQPGAWGYGHLATVHHKAALGARRVVNPAAKPPVDVDEEAGGGGAGAYTCVATH